MILLILYVYEWLFKRLKKLWLSKCFEFWIWCGILNFEFDVVYVFILYRKLKKKKVKIIIDIGYLLMES